ncbi:MAG: hypothetical protein PHF37_00385 [Phycisphaerae bacterium]|nr:hypothetical protein [Phycisphaerae bacterium]
MQTAKKNQPQGFLFSEPSVAETGVWCNLNPGIDPAEWAYLCRYLGSLTPKEFKKASKKIYGNPDSVLTRFKRAFCFEQSDIEGIPLLAIGKMA